VLRVDHDALQRMMAEDDELCDLMLRTLWARREMLRHGPAAWTLKVVGSSRDADSAALRRYAERLELVHTWVDVDDPNLDHDVWAHGYTRADLRVAIVQGEIVRNATPGQVAEMLGLAYTAEDDTEFDLAVVGAGPAGLAAAIYGASEGLRTVLLDAVAPGGQSATTSRIENYLGFPFGVSGDALTSQASLQAFKFGVRIAAPCPVGRLDPESGVHRLLSPTGRSSAPAPWW
jgi:thioredoxin reductase (NADPH)